MAYVSCNACSTEEILGKYKVVIDTVNCIHIRERASETFPSLRERIWGGSTELRPHYEVENPKFEY